jgi:hypothetical protein
VRETAGSLVLSYRKPNWGSISLVVLVLFPLSAGCAGAFDPAGALVVPFVGVWSLGFCGLFRAFVTTEEVRLWQEGLDYRRGALLPRRRRVPLRELKEVRAGTIQTSVVDETEKEYCGPHRPPPTPPRSGNELVRRPCLRFETLGEPVLFAGGINPQEQRWLVSVLRPCLDALRADVPAVEGEVPAAGDGPWVLRLSSVPLRSPSDSSARLHLRPGCAEFSWPGAWERQLVGTTTFLHLFWNSGVGVFALVVLVHFNLGLCLFLTPFVLIGLWFFAIWVVAVTAPAWRLTWVFRENEIVRRYRGPGIGWAKQHALRGNPGEALLDRIELHRAEGEEVQCSTFVACFRPRVRHALYALSLVRPEGKELLRIDLLTEGEARWMADTLFRTFPGWFPAADSVGSEA